MSSPSSNKQPSYNYFEEKDYRETHIVKTNRKMPVISDYPTEEAFLEAYHQYLYETITLKATQDNITHKNEAEPSVPAKIFDGIWAVFLGIMTPVAIYAESIFALGLFLGGIYGFWWCIINAPELCILSIIVIGLGAFFTYYMFSEMKWWQIVLVIVFDAIVSIILVYFNLEEIIGILFSANI